MEVSYLDTPGWYGTALAKAAEAAYNQHRRNHGLVYPWRELPINSHNDWILVVNKAVQAWQEAERHTTLERVLKRLEDDEIEFLRDEFIIAADQESARVTREFARALSDEEEEEWYGPADQCHDTLEIRRHGHIVTTRVTQEQR